MDKETKVRGPKALVGAWFAAGACVLAGFLIMTWASSSTAGFRALGFFMPMVLTAALSLVVVPAVVTGSWATEVLARKGRLPSWVTPRSILTPGLVLLLVQACMAVHQSRPRTRLARALGSADGISGEVRVVGFAGLLASRWLYEFKTTPALVESICRRLGLQEVEPYDLSERLRRDSTLQDSASVLVGNTPTAEGVRMFRKSENGESSNIWDVLVFRESDGKCWLYQGHQR